MIPQLLAHLWGDYILQSDWMAQNKTKAHWPAFVHALVYSLLFAPLCLDTLTYGWYRLGTGPWIEYNPHPHHFRWLPWLVIFGTHFLIDRYRVARYVVWAKNWMGPRKAWYRIPWGSGIRWTDVDEGVINRYCTAPMPPFHACPTGYPPTVPPWMAVWLLIIADNTLHLTINYLALRYL